MVHRIKTYKQSFASAHVDKRVAYFGSNYLLFTSERFTTDFTSILEQDPTLTYHIHLSRPSKINRYVLSLSVMLSWGSKQSSCSNHRVPIYLQIIWIPNTTIMAKCTNCAPVGRSCYCSDSAMQHWFVLTLLVYHRLSPQTLMYRVEFWGNLVCFSQIIMM